MAQTPSATPSRSPLLEPVELLGKLLGVTAAALIVLSTAYDFSFLYALGLSFEEIPSSMADHVRSAIVWAPRAAIYVLAFVLYELCMRFVEGGRSEEEIIQQSRTPRFLQAFRKGPAILFGLLAAVLVSVNLLFTSQVLGLYLGAITAWGIVSTAAVSHPKIAGGLSVAARRSIVVVPILVIWIGTMGYSRGIGLLSEKTATWTVELKADPTPTKIKVLGLRQYQSHTVVVLESRTIQIVPNDRIGSTAKVYDSAQDKSRLCKWANMACPVGTAKP